MEIAKQGKIYSGKTCVVGEGQSCCNANKFSFVKLDVNFTEVGHQLEVTYSVAITSPRYTY